MLHHFYKITLRNFLKHKSSFAINLVSLTSGLTCAILIFLWVNDEWQTDKFHGKDERLFQVMKHAHNSGNIHTSVHTPGPMAQAMKENIPEVEYAVTVVDWFDGFNLTLDEKNFTGKGYYAGEDFFKIFSFDLLEGDEKEVLKAINSVVISESMAEYFFGSSKEAIGKTLTLNGESEVMITGVFKDVTARSTQQFDFVLTIESYATQPRFQWILNWGNSGPKTYVTLKENASAEGLNSKLNALYASNIELEEGEEISLDFFLKRYSDQYLLGNYENGEIAGGRMEYVKLFSVIGIFILLIACINFTNLATARATRRAKEVGVRKTIGANKKSLIFQYLFESTSLAIISFLIAIAFIQLLLPQFNLLTEKSISLEWSPRWFAVFGGLTLVTGLLAGSYPALYLTAFKPVEVLKGIVQSKWGELFVRRGLVVFQFTVSVILIIAVTVIYRQIQFVQNQHLGYEKDRLVEFIMNIQDRDKIGTFISEAKRLEGIVNISTGNSPVNLRNRTTGVHWDGKAEDSEIGFGLFGAHYGLTETLGMKIKEGRSFSEEYGSEGRNIIVNEKTIETMNFDNPIGQIVRLGEHHEYEIIGVVEDFHFQSFYEEIQPLIIRLLPQATPQIFAKLEKGKEQIALKGLEALFVKFNPEMSFRYTFPDQSYNELYTAEEQVATLSQIFAGLAILISCLGLLGLVSFLVYSKEKEIGIRKILGADAFGIVRLLSKDFLKLVAIAVIIAAPIAWFGMKNWLSEFAYHVDLQWNVIALAALVTIGIAVLTVSFQSIKAALANPVNSLKNE